MHPTRNLVATAVLVASCAAPKTEPSQPSSDAALAARADTRPSSEPNPVDQPGFNAIDQPKPAAYEPPWTPGSLWGAPIPVSRAEFDEAEVVLNEQNAATGEVRFRGRTVAHDIEHCPEFLDNPPKALTIHLNPADDTDWHTEHSRENRACLTELAKKTRLAMYERGGDRTYWVPPGATMLSLGRVETDIGPNAKLEQLHANSIDLKDLEDVPALESLRMFETYSHERLSELRSLKWLEAPGSVPVDVVVDLPNLEYLFLAAPLLKNRDIELLASMTNLRELHLRKAEALEPLDFTPLAKTTHLEVLNLRLVALDDENLRLLETMEKTTQVLLQPPLE